jgi:membrane protease YdiL (CAAX protease family)
MARPQVREPRWGFGEAALAFVAGIFLALLAGSIAVSAGAATTSATTVSVSFIAQWAGFVGVPVWLSRTRGTGSLKQDFGLELRPIDVALGLAMAVALVIVVAGYGGILRQFDHVNLSHEADQLNQSGFVVLALFAGVGAPIAEELLFRGLAQPALQRRLGEWQGLVLTAVLFGLVHFSGNPVEAIPPLTVVGLGVGLLAWRTGRLGPGIVAHMAFNGVTVLQYALK